MMDYMEQAKILRASTQPHYNCCQSILVTFAKEMGLTPEQAYAMGAHFASGMRLGGTCGVLTGALMVLGGAGMEEQQALTLLRTFQQRHESCDCIPLLKASHARGEAKKNHCDGLVFELVEYLSQIL